MRIETYHSDGRESDSNSDWNAGSVVGSTRA